MSRYIKADKVKHDILFLFSRNKELIDEWLVYCVDEVIDEQPTADVRENVHAEWLPYEFGTKRWHKCSACGIADEYINEKGLEARREYCPHCGAQMDKRRRENE